MPRRRQARTVTASTSRTTARSLALGQRLMTSAKLAGGGVAGRRAGAGGSTGFGWGEILAGMGDRYALSRHDNKTVCICRNLLHNRARCAT